MSDREKVIGHLNDSIEASRKDNTWVFVRKDIVEDVIDLLKEQEAREQCLKTKCVICPHCSNCDVDENGQLKKQEPMKPNRSGTHTFCAKCGAAFKNSADFCPHCGQEIKWE